MRRLAIFFAILAATSTIEQIALPGKSARVIEARRNLRRVLISLADWRGFLLGPLRMLQRAARPDAFPWWNQIN
jgi:hypothetical protein